MLSVRNPRWLTPETESCRFSVAPADGRCARQTAIHRRRTWEASCVNFHASPTHGRDPCETSMNTWFIKNLLLCPQKRLTLCDDFLYAIY